jgi:hypothetical protein
VKETYPHRTLVSSLDVPAPTMRNEEYQD